MNKFVYTLQSICNELGVELASVLSNREERQIYTVFTDAARTKQSFCSTDTTGQCQFPYIGLRKPFPILNTVSIWQSLKWTDGSDVSYVNWGSGEPSRGINIQCNFFNSTSIYLINNYL